MRRGAGVDRVRGYLCALVAGALGACASFGSETDPDPGVDSGTAQTGGVDAAPAPDGAPDAQLGSEERPAESCAALVDEGNAENGLYWVRPGGVGAAFEVYCEQHLAGGGWALLYNSVLTAGVTTGFWDFGYAERLSRIGTASPDSNFYHGDLYLAGTEFMDVIVDLNDVTAVAAQVTTTGFDHVTMHFASPTLTSGHAALFAAQFASGWSSNDHDSDTHATVNCATHFSGVAQHYGACWRYNLGSDADEPFLDGGVGPHVHNATLTEIGLTPQADGGGYSRVKRIARFVRW